MIVFNRVINRVILSFIITFVITTSVHSIEMDQQKPVHEFKTCEQIYQFLGLDLRDSVEIVTKNYIFLLNFQNNHTLIISRTDNIMFAGVNIYNAYMITGSDDSSVWQLYAVKKTMKDSIITKKFYEMQIEWKECMLRGCPADNKESDELVFEEGMTMF